MSRSEEIRARAERKRAELVRWVSREIEGKSKRVLLSLSQQTEKQKDAFKKEATEVLREAERRLSGKMKIIGRMSRKIKKLNEMMSRVDVGTIEEQIKEIKEEVARRIRVRAVQLERGRKEKEKQIERDFEGISKKAMAVLGEEAEMDEDKSCFQ